jgi:ankyrin repeat protein
VEADTPADSPVVQAPRRQTTWKRSSLIFAQPAPNPVELPFREAPPCSEPARPQPQTLYEGPTSANSVSKDQYEAFWIAAEEGHVAQVEKQIRKGVDVNAFASAGDCISQHGTALVAAVSNGHEDVVRCLLKHGARPNKAGNPNSVCLPLHTAACLRHIKIVKILLNNGANPAVQGGHYRFALTAAAVGGDLRIVNILLEYGAVLNACDQENETALHGAVMGGSLEMVQHLLEKGINPDVSGDQGTALKLALTLEQQEPGTRREIIQLLGGVVPDPPTPVQQRPNLAVNTAPEPEEDIDPALMPYVRALLVAALVFSARDGNLEDVQQLLDPPEPVDPNETFGEDYTYALHAASANGHVIVVQLLLECGAEVEARGGQLDYALHFAAYNGHAFVVKLLLAWGADVNKVGETTRVTPLQLASKGGHLACMQLLMDQGAYINVATGPLGSPLHAAASSSLQATQLLLLRGADPRVVDEIGLTTADTARAFEQHETKRLLKQCGSPRSSKFSAQRFVAWTMSWNMRMEQQVAVQKEQALQNLIQQYAAAAATNSSTQPGG